MKPMDALTLQGIQQPGPRDGLLHGAVLRPPRMCWDGAQRGGARLQACDGPAAERLPGVVAVVRQQDFVGVVAVSAVQALQALGQLHPIWRDAPGTGAAALAHDGITYRWSAPPRSAPAGAAATVWCANGHASVWAPCTPAQQPAVQAELAALLAMPAEHIRVEPMAGAPAHLLDLLDAAADAALLSRAVGRPVRVPLTAPAGTTMLAVQADASANALHAAVPWAMRPSLARLLSLDGATALPAPEQPQGMAVQFAPHGAAPGLAHADPAAFAAAQVFAQESLLDEQAARLGGDRIAQRLAQLPEGPARELATQLTRQAGWHTGADASALARHNAAASRAGWRRGRGFAQAHVRSADSETWSAWVAEVAVEPATGRIEVERVLVGRDSRDLHAAQGATIRQQDAQLLDAARRLLAAPPRFDDWGAAPTADATTRGAIETAAAPLPAIDHGQLASDGVLTLPAAAAIANAIHDATGVRLREVPFDSEQLRGALAALPAAKAPTAPGWLGRGAAWLAAGAGAAAALLATAWPAKPAIAPTDGPDVSLYTAAAIERGRLVATAGDCVVCHTAPGGASNAGGLPLHTPFGAIYSTNITPDLETGIGRWSYAAFERAMRQGVHRDGRQLYPAFPYTAFARISDADMQALYAWLMTQPAVRQAAPENDLRFPFNQRPLLAGWNLLFHDDRPFTPDPTRSLEWNRGAYLVEGAGHCAACHSPRNALGAEKTGPEHHLAGGMVDGWQAPALHRLAEGAQPWTAEQLFQYLRTGFASGHGVAAGPMAPVVHGLAALPESDVRAMVSYLLDLPGRPAAQPVATTPAPQPAAAPLAPFPVQGERLYQNACAVCHEAGAGPTLFGVKPLLASNPNLHAASPDNLIQVILHGIQAPAQDDLGYMPGFADSLDDRQVAELLGYLRARFAPQAAPWADAQADVARVRAQAQ